MGFYYANQGSRSYWAERQFDKMHKLKKEEDVVIRDLNRTYNRAFNEISRELNNFYIKYAQDNHLTLQMAQQRLTPIELREYRESMEYFKRVYKNTRDENILRQMSQLSARREITRYQALLDEIDKKLIEVSNEVQITFEDYLSGAYTGAYNDSLKSLGIDAHTVINHRAVEEIIRYPFSGAMFSDRIWRNKNQLLNWINDDLTKGIIRGDSIQKMGKSLKDRCRSTRYQAERLVRTESCHAYTQGTLDGYTDSKVVDAVEILTAGDERMCPTCSSKDGVVVPLDEARAGDNIPPVHPNCRCCILPTIIEDTKNKRSR